MPTSTQREGMDRAALASCIAAACLSSGAALAGQDQADDSDRIPEAAAAEDQGMQRNDRLSTASFASVGAEKVRQTGQQADAVARAVLDSRLRWMQSSQTSFSLSGRLTEHTGDTGIKGDSSSRLDMREFYVEHRPTQGNLLRAGRVNLRTGVAYAYNPTDYFRQRAIVDPTTRDPAVQRENRLGSVMIQGQSIFDKASATALVAPKLASPRGLSSSPSFWGHSLSDTNSATRAMVKATYELGNDLNPEFVFYKSGGDRPRFGFNLTRGIGNNLTAYLEASGGRRLSVHDSAIRFGVDTGELVPAALAMVESGPRNLVDVALGATLASEYQVSLTIEYDYHQAGITGDQWRTAREGSAEQRRVFSYVRSYSKVMQEPLFRQALFIRVQADNVLTRGLTVSGFINRSLDDKSSYRQVLVEYQLTSSHSIKAMYATNSGGPGTLYGGESYVWNALVSYAYYF